jgi:hypothetical protein
MENYSEMYLVDSPGPYEVALELKKGLSHDIGWIKLAENLGASPFERDLSINTTFSQIHLAG